MKRLTSFFILCALSSPFLSNCSDSASFTVYTSLSSSASSRNLVTRDCARDPMSCSGSPEVMTLKIYAVWVSQNADCSAAVLVSDFGAGGQDVSLGVNPLIQASPANGTYQCMIMKMSDNLRFIPDAEAISDHAGCSADTEAIFDIYRTDSGDTDTWKDMDGNTITASGAGTTPGDDTVYIYATTDAAAVQSGAIGANVNQTATLTGALVVPGQTTFYADFTDGVTSDSGVCKIEGGTGLGFR